MELHGKQQHSLRMHKGSLLWVRCTMRDVFSCALSSSSRCRRCREGLFETKDLNVINVGNGFASGRIGKADKVHRHLLLLSLEVALNLMLGPGHIMVRTVTTTQFPQDPMFHVVGNIIRKIVGRYRNDVPPPLVGILVVMVVGRHKVGPGRMGTAQARVGVVALIKVKFGTQDIIVQGRPLTGHGLTKAIVEQLIQGGSW